MFAVIPFLELLLISPADGSDLLFGIGCYRTAGLDRLQLLQQQKRARAAQ
jgi:hypothetical protein